MNRMATFADNKKARFDYELLDTFEAGLVLAGHEVKAVRAGRADLTGAHVLIRGGEAFLVGMTIPPFQTKNTPEKYEADKPRRLLLNKKELNELAGAEAKRGLTLVAISLYNKGRLLKLSFAIAKGKKKFDKRETIKSRDSKREMERTLKNHR
jgi:SsrA-binding protein